MLSPAEVEKYAATLGLAVDPTAGLCTTATEIAKVEVAALHAALPDCFGTVKRNIDVSYADPATRAQIYPCRVCMVSALCEFAMSYQKKPGRAFSEITNEYSKVIASIGKKGKEEGMSPGLPLPAIQEIDRKSVV